jgi:hypothetical protein
MKQRVAAICAAAVVAIVVNTVACDGIKRLLGLGEPDPTEQAVANMVNWNAVKHEVSSRDLGFKIAFPGEPTREVQRLKDRLGNNLPITIYTLDLDEAAYVLSVVEIPPAGPKMTIDQRLEGGVKGALANANKPVNVKVTPCDDLAGVPGKRVTFDDTVEGRATRMDMRIFFTNSNGYQIGALETVGAQGDSKRWIDWFFGSLELMQPKETKET